VGEHQRIFNILLNNISYRQWPEERGKTSGFAMLDDRSPGELEYLTLPDDERFQKRCLYGLPSFGL
jgi:hypothetical protein